MAIVRTELCARDASSFCDFEKMNAISPWFYSCLSLGKRNFCMCLAKSILANICPIMIHLDALDFNVCRSEEVISFFWRSVYNEDLKKKIVI